MKTRIYTVIDKEGTVRLVRACNSAQALRHVASDTFRTFVSSQEELVEAVSNNVKVEDAGEQPEING